MVVERRLEVVSPPPGLEQAILAQSGKREGSEIRFLCPAHDDHHPSARWNPRKQVWRCDACGASGGWKDLSERLGISIPDWPRKKPAALASPGLTLERYALEKKIPRDFLEQQGLTQITYLGKPAVRIPYRDTDRKERSVRFRLSMTGRDRFRCRKGDKARPYGEWRLSTSKEHGLVVVVEGESDAQTLWLYGIPALGLPGANTWREDYVPLFDGVEKVYLIVEPDQGGTTLLNSISKSKLRDRVFHLADRFDEVWPKAVEAATPLATRLSEQLSEDRERYWRQCSELARSQNILDRFSESLQRSGVVGEDKVGKILYLAVTSRFLDRPVSSAVKGPSSAGKSFITAKTLEFFPDSAFHALTGYSERLLAYSDEPLKHRFLVLYEAAGIGREFGSYLLRSLLSEGRLRYGTVEKTKEGMRARLIEREGPTGLIVTTTAVRLHHENETRLLSLTLTDSREQTKAIMRTLAAENHEGVDLSVWHALQEWARLAEHRVTVPYAGELADRVPPAGVRRISSEPMPSFIRHHGKKILRVR
jgi:hypothetical protein